ncbi:MAG: SMP-30/gluconolactonase/LRE family protein [Rhodobacteraceae bacterium]|nr:SMP-30/gluconolactonase/LRE family protein [Paracoccaceae bacterium]
MSQLFDNRPCLLGEGPLWHPERGQLFWFDILNRRMFSRDGDRQLDWSFDDYCSAAGWIDRDRLLVASESALWVMDLDSGARDRVTGLEADNPLTRSNDGRADPWGGFWIGTMGKKAEAGAGSIWRYYRGELRRLYPGISITNAISFSPDRRFACFADTARQKVWRVALDPLHGWPKGEAEIFIDHAAHGLNPDGAVFDSEGQLWIAEWGASRVACYGPDGAFRRAVTVGGRHASCPAFGGADLATLYVTSARLDLSAAVLAAEPDNGCTFATDPGVRGLPDDQVIL